VFRRYAQAGGLDLGRYDACMKAGKYAGRIQASVNEGLQVGVNSTPTLLVGDRLYRGRLDSDAITKLVDSLAPRRAQ
jgi:protein-disulfide isomerase